MQRHGDTMKEMVFQRCHWGAGAEPRTQDEVLDQLEFILLLVFQHALEVLLPAGNVDRPNGLINRLPWGHVLHLAP